MTWALGLASHPCLHSIGRESHYEEFQMFDYVDKILNFEHSNETILWLSLLVLCKVTFQSLNGNLPNL